MRSMMPRSASTALGWRNPSVVTRSTLGLDGQRCSRACRICAVVDLPTATEPATPMMKGTFWSAVLRKRVETLCRP
ncbi:hypothetical protein D3C72_2388130 [compost metagenome]